MSSGRSGGHLSKPPKAPVNDPGRNMHSGARVTHQEAIKGRSDAARTAGIEV
jgi:hypothetical protein